MMDTSKETVLDPRYSPTNIGTQSSISRILQPDGTFLSEMPYPLDDTRNPSRFFVVYETGDSAPVEEGLEATPWDMYYSRATEWGDEYDTVDHLVSSTGLYEERWDWVENKDPMAGEASMAASPGGDFMWVVWNQWVEDETGEVSESDPIFRRFWWFDPNEPPVADAGGVLLESSELLTYYALPDEVIYLDATASTDVDGTIVSYTWDLDNDGVFETDGAIVPLVASGSIEAPAVLVCDDLGACDVDQVLVNGDPEAPRVWSVELASAPPALTGEEVEVTARFDGPLPSTEYSVLVTWGDGTASVGTVVEDEPGTAIATHVYEIEGTFEVTFFVSDDEGNESYASALLVVYPAVTDADWDGVPDGDDNCPFTPNPDQADGDADDVGDACDLIDDDDIDEDGIANTVDNCPFAANADQRDTDTDGVGDACDDGNGLDLDADGWANHLDNCAFIYNPTQLDSDHDGVGDACDTTDGLDLDGDGVDNEIDNCPFDHNPDQSDLDFDSLGDPATRTTRSTPTWT